MLTLEQRMDRWEDQRAIKNLLGKFSNCLILNREQVIFDLFWSEAEDICLGLNDGWYRGQAAVKGYYDACVRRNMLVARLIRDKFPEELAGKSDEEIYGIGPMKVKPVATPVIEVAEDGATAKGLWSCLGSHSDVEPCGPIARWSWGYYAVDFIRENGAWKIWHMQYTNDLDVVCGDDWGQPAKEYPELPEFAELKNFPYPPYTEEESLRVQYSPVRPLTLAPRIPEPYTTFQETFSYAVKEV